MKKKILISVLLLLSIVFMVQAVYAASKDAAIFYSTHYSNLSDVSAAMSKAGTTYQNRGYSSKIWADPEAVSFIAAVKTKQVLLFFCHGNHQLIATESGARFNSWRYKFFRYNI